MRLRCVICHLLACLVATVMVGCSKPAPESAASSTETAKPELTEADKAAIEKQKLCLVALEPLGSMGTPIKVSVKGRDVYICCSGCRDEVLEHPDKYLARINAAGEVVKPADEAAPAVEMPAASGS